MKTKTAEAPPSRKSTGTLTVRCPSCGGPSVYHADNPYRPFCTARCKQIDLGAWSSEQFRVEARPDPSDEAHAD